MIPEDENAFNELLIALYETTEFGSLDKEVRQELAEAILVYLSDSVEPGSYLLSIVQG